MPVSIRKIKSLPWFIAMLDPPYLFLTSKSIPETVSDTKEINYSDTQIPGGRTSMQKFGSLGARNINFDIRFAEFNDLLGVTQTISILEYLRKPSGLLDFETKPFTPNPKVLYYSGTASLVPLTYFVKKCDFTLSVPNSLGKPQVVDVSFSLTLDETTDIYKAESAAQFAKAALGTIKGLSRTIGTTNPYKKRSFF